METLTIGSLAQKAGVGVETVRYYERRGIIDRPAKPSAGYRKYPASIVVRIRFVKNAQELGFSLKEIAELLELRVDPDSTCDDVRRQAQEKVVDITEKIRALQQMKTALARLIKMCNTSAAMEECPILDVLEERVDHGDS
jgi:MerR family copper efflux transcriptional regulator